MKRCAFAALWLALLGQVLWMLGRYVTTHAPGDKTLYDGAIVLAFVALAATGGRMRRLAAALRILVGLAFLGSVADRFGLFGRTGAPGVSWGDFAHFVAYTRAVNAFLPAGWAPALAMLATLGEAMLGLALLLGVRPQLAARGATALLLLFAIAMAVSLGLTAPFPYAVWVLATGAWALATIDASALGLDAYLTRRIPHARPPGIRQGGARTIGATRDGR
jgi:putative oxidoreductase